MTVGLKVIIIWGTYKGSKGFITTLNGKNVTVKLDQGFEIALSTDHIKLVPEKQTTIINKIKELFGENYVIKSKKVNELVETELIRYNCSNPYDALDIHHFTTPNKYKVGKQEFEIVLKATQMKNGKWWIQG